MRAFLLLMITLNPLIAGLDRYSDLVVADPAKSSANRNRVRITYLGTNGYQLETAGHSLLIDPYFSRISLPRAAFGWPVRPDPQRIEAGLAHLAHHADAILITHAHFDHLLDAPTVMERTGARLVGSATAIELANRVGADRRQCSVVKPGDTRTFGPWDVSVLAASHDRVPLIGVPFNRPLAEKGAPRRAADWVCGQPLAYLISADGEVIYIDSGGTSEVLPPSNLGPVDLAIVGVALSDSRDRLAATLRRLRPRYILPSHQDNFFIPLSRGFQFSRLSNFPSIVRQHREQHLPGRLILLDYFHPWTLPPR